MIFFDNWGRFRRPSVIYVPVKCPRGGGIWSPEWTQVRRLRQLHEGVYAWLGTLYHKEKVLEM